MWSVKREAFDHPKFRLCARDLRISMSHMRGIMESLWHVTATNWPRGDVGRWSNEEIAVAIDYDGDADELIAALTKRRLVDASDEHRLVVHDWPQHADSYVHATIARRGLYFATGEEPRLSHDLFNASTRDRIRVEYARRRAVPSAEDPGAAPEAPRTIPAEVRDESGTGPGLVPAIPVSEPVPTKEEDTGDEAPPPSDLDDPDPEDDEPPLIPEARPPRLDRYEVEFTTDVRPLYPRRQGDHRWPDALSFFRAARKKGVALEVIVAGVRRYAAYCDREGLVGSQYVKQAASFFGRNRCWEATWEGTAPPPRVDESARFSRNSRAPEEPRQNIPVVNPDPEFERRYREQERLRRERAAEARGRA